MLRSFLLGSSSVAPQALRKELTCALAKKWPSEFKRLCQPMKYSPSVLHGLVNISEKDLPSSILLQSHLLLDKSGQVQAQEKYDRKDYVELNRGMSSAISLSYILRNDCYDELVGEQKNENTLSREDYLQLHDQFYQLLRKDEVWDEQLLDVMFYAVLFNDLGKNIELKRMLQEVYQIKEHDHDLILRNAFQIDGLLEDFSRFSPSQQRCLRAMWHSGFNPSSFDTLEYPLSIAANWVMSFASIAEENTSLYLAMKKIEILIDIAGVNGNNSKGAGNLTKSVIKKFDKSFAILSQLLVVHQQQLDAGVTNKELIYTAILNELKSLLLEHAKNLKITAANELTPRTVLLLRVCKMLGINDQAQTIIVDTILKNIEQQYPDNYKTLEHEFSWSQDHTKPTLWIECIPKFIWLMSKRNHNDFVDHCILQNFTDGVGSGLYAGLIIVSNILKKIRDDDQYEELYTFENNELVRTAPGRATLMVGESIALFVAYDLVRVAQQASESNSNLEAKEEAERCLKTLWSQGALINGRYITTSKMPVVSTQSSLVTKSYSFFNNYQEYVAEQQEKWLAFISKETDEHRSYLASIGWADRANYFKVRSFIYQDINPGTIDITRFSHTMALPEMVSAFNKQEQNTLFVNPESTQQQEIKRSLDIRLYPTIRRIITEKGADVFLGSKAELQVYAGSCKEKIIVEVEIPSSVKFYIALNNSGDVKVYISGIVSHENLIQQLITLKLADIDPQKITILGNTQQYKLIAKDDLLAFEKQVATDFAKRNVLIVAGCNLEDMVCSTLEQMFVGKMSKRKFSGQLTSLTYVQSQHVPNVGFIVLNLNYGEICEEQITTILEKFNCIGIFSGSAAGYIPNLEGDKLPDIGTRVPVHSARHHSGEVTSLDSAPNKGLHLQVPTIFVETFSWLKRAREYGASTVDVETYYILRAIQHYKKENSHVKLHNDIGVFVSDYVGEKPLRSYDRVFAQYPLALQNFVKQVLVANITSSYNNNRTSTPVFASQYFKLNAENIEISQYVKREAVVDAIGKLWDKSEFSRRVHTPLTIGSVKNKEQFATQIAPRCLHLPIKLPGSEIRVPIEYQHFADELQQIFNFEASINAGWNELYAYLTVDQGFVARANSQRVPGPHVDGIPRDRESPGTQLIDHAYLVTNAIPTMFYTQQFDMNPYDPKMHHFFAIFRALADESRTITAKPFEIALMNAYSVHTPTQTQEDVNRTFIRLEFSTLKFDRIGNSVNPHFSCDNKFPDYPFNYVPRPIPEHLFVPPNVYLNKPITNADYLHESIDRLGRLNLQAIFTQDKKFKLKYSDYKSLNLIAEEIMNEENQGIVISHQGIPQAFSLYKVENKVVKLNTLFTLDRGMAQEAMIYMMKILKQLSDRLSMQAGLEEGATPITIVVNENNENMLPYFLRAARLSKLHVNIERLGISHQLRPGF